MAIELYWGSGSPFAWRVMLTLEVKGPAGVSKLSKVWDVSFTGDPPK